MLKQKIKNFILLTFSFFLFAMPVIVNASAADALKGGFFQNALGKKGANVIDESVTGQEQQVIAQRIGVIIQQVLAFLGVVILVVIIYGGFMWLTAGGNADKAAKARQLIFNAFIGAVIIGAAYAISAMILSFTQ